MKSVNEAWNSGDGGLTFALKRKLRSGCAGDGVGGDRCDDGGSVYTQGLNILQDFLFLAFWQVQTEHPNSP